MRKVLCCLVSSLCVASFSSITAAQTDVEVDPAHYKLEFENNCVRVSRASFGPHEKTSSFFDTHDAVFVSLTDSEGFKLIHPDGSSRVTAAFRAGAVAWVRGHGGGTTGKHWRYAIGVHHSRAQGLQLKNVSIRG
jgi:hypothetical protein